MPAVQLVPKNRLDRTVVWIDAAGKAGLYDTDGSLKAPIRSLLAAGCTIVGSDLLYQGEFLDAGDLDAGDPPARQRSLPGEEAFGGWTYCYNLPVFAHRVHDVLALIRLAKTNGKVPQQVTLVGLGQAGKWAAAASAQAQGALAHAVIDTEGFRFDQLTDVYDIDFLPGAVKYLDLPGLLALSAPTPLWLAGEGNVANPPRLVAAAYTASGARNQLKIESARTRSETESAAAHWIISLRTAHP